MYFLLFYVTLFSEKCAEYTPVMMHIRHVILKNFI